MSIVTTAASFNLSFPSSLDVIFSTVETVGQTAKVFLSLDCFIMTTGMVTSTGTTVYFKVLLTGILPIILIIIPIFPWLIIKVIPWFKISWRGFRDKYILSIIVLLYIVHPSVTSEALLLFNCYSLSDELWLYTDLSIECWTS